MTTNKQDTYSKVTALIVERLEAGTIPWAQSWVNRPVHNAITGHQYQGINHLLLTLHAVEDPRFLTFKQAQQAGGNVRKGEKATPVLFMTNSVSYKRKKKGTEPDEAPQYENVNKTYQGLIARLYWVFNVAQCEGLKPDLMVEPLTPEFREAEAIVRAMPLAPPIIGSESPAYSPPKDIVFMPPRANYTNDGHYYADLFHELAHATGHKTRLDRPLLGTKARDRKLADLGIEELTAELTAANLCAVAGLPFNVDEHAGYVQSWLRAVRDNPKALVQAASAASKAANYILGEAN